jgi:anti-anti-sigma factor
MGTPRCDALEDGFAVAGELDMATGPAMVDRVRHLAERGPTTVRLDLGGTEFLDAAGVRCLLAAKRHVESRGGVLVVTPPPRFPHRVLALCGVCQFLGLPPPETAQGHE